MPRGHRPKACGLRGTSPPIHEVNERAPLNLTESNVLDYLRFFCWFVRSEDGSFLLAEDMDGPDIPTDMDEQTRAIIKDAVRPANYQERDEHGSFLCDAVLLYSGALFNVNFTVKPSGMVEMLDDEQIAGDLNVKIDSLIE